LSQCLIQQHAMVVLDESEWLVLCHGHFIHGGTARA
jgi:hypothetical protein